MNDAASAHRLAELSTRLARCPDLDTLVSSTLAGLADLFGYEHSLLLLLDERGERLYTIASHGYATEGIGSEVRVGDGIIGMAAARAEPMRVGNLEQMLAYARTVRRAYEERGGEAPGLEIPLPGPRRRREPGRRAGDGARPARRRSSRSRASGGSRSTPSTRRC